MYALALALSIKLASSSDGEPTTWSNNMKIMKTNKQHCMLHDTSCAGSKHAHVASADSKQMTVACSSRVLHALIHYLRGRHHATHSLMHHSRKARENKSIDSI